MSFYIIANCLGFGYYNYLFIRNIRIKLKLWACEPYTAYLPTPNVRCSGVREPDSVTSTGTQYLHWAGLPTEGNSGWAGLV